MTLLFESFMVFYLLEIMVLLSVYFFTNRESKVDEVVIKKETNNTPLVSDIIKMRSLQKQLERQT